MSRSQTTRFLHGLGWALLTWSGLSLPASAQAPESAPRIRLLVERGETASGTGGLVFEHFGEHPGAGELRARPSIDARGNVAFDGLFGDGDIETNDTLGGIFLIGDTLEAIVLAGAPAPGTSSVFEDFGFRLGITPRIHDGRVTFIALIEDSLRAGVWGDRFGPLEKIVLEDESLPDTPPGTTLFDFATTSRRGRVIINGIYNESNPVTSANEGIWRDADGTLVTVAVNGQAAPGIDGAVFSDEHSSTNVGPFDIWNVGPLGRLVFNAYVDGPRVDETNDEGVWIETAEGLALLVREGEKVPDSNTEQFGVRSGFRSFGTDEVQPARNGRGTIVFGASVSSPQFTRARTIWIRRNGQLERIATGFTPLDTNPLGDPAPGYGPGQTFTAFDLAHLNERDRLVFGAFVDTGDILDQAFAIFREFQGALELVVGEQLPSPVVANATTDIVFCGPFTDEGRLFYTAGLSGPGITPSDDEVLVMVEPDGRHRLLLHEGKAVDLEGDGQGPRVVTGFDLGLGAARDHTVVLEIFFGDGSAGIASITPEKRGLGRLPDRAGMFGPPGR